MTNITILLKFFFLFIFFFFVASLVILHTNKINYSYLYLLEDKCTNSDFKCNTSVVKRSNQRGYNSQRFTPNEKIKYILRWTPAECNGFPQHFKERQCVFKNYDCEYNNCFFTSDRNLLDEITEFHVIVFSGHEDDIPQTRSSSQKYVFSEKESPERDPVCMKLYDNFFNWTWTYRLDSDSYWGYIEILDSNDTIIGPKQEMHWMKSEHMKPVPKKFRKKLIHKKQLVAWFVSKCETDSKREDFVKALNAELKPRGHKVDIYGECGPFKCDRNDPDCNRMMGTFYYFYLALENSIDEDYVTEKLLRALNYNTVPIVYGGANYTRFMPDGIYLNARELSVKKLAAKMIELVQNFDQYVEYFRWKSHYSYRESLRSDYCRICALLNNETKMKEITVRGNFLKWWNHPNQCLS